MFKLLVGPIIVLILFLILATLPPQETSSTIYAPDRYNDPAYIWIGR